MFSVDDAVVFYNDEKGKYEYGTVQEVVTDDGDLYYTVETESGAIVDVFAEDLEGA